MVFFKFMPEICDFFILNIENISELNKIILHVLKILFSCIVISNKSFYIYKKYLSYHSIHLYFSTFSQNRNILIN